MSHSNKIMYAISLGEVRMYFANGLAGSQIVEKDGAMGPTAQYKLEVGSVSAKHWLRMSEIFLYSFLCREYWSDVIER